MMKALSFIAVAVVCCGTLQAQENSFVEFVVNRLRKDRIGSANGLHLQDFCSFDQDPFANRVFYEYGAMFAASRDVRVPPKCIFESAANVTDFQQGLDRKKHLFGSVEIELQDAAMDQLRKAVDEASRLRMAISPLDGTIAGKRSYEDTVRIWNSRFYRALDFWVRKGKIKEEEAVPARTAPTRAQIEKVIAWEEQNYCFSTDFTKSIFYSVAPPGTSQHLSMLAFDVAEAGDPRIRKILNRFGWYQTIRTDQPHFTFLGVEESELPKRGLQRIQVQGNTYWIPSRGPADVAGSFGETRR